MLEKIEYSSPSIPPKVGMIVMLRQNRIRTRMPAIITRVHVDDKGQGLVDLVGFWAGVRARTTPVVSNVRVPYTSEPPADGVRVSRHTRWWAYMEDVEASDKLALATGEAEAEAEAAPAPEDTGEGDGDTGEES